MAVKKVTKAQLARHAQILEVHNKTISTMWEKEVARVKKLRKANRQLRAAQREIGEQISQLRRQMQNLVSVSVRPWD